MVNNLTLTQNASLTTNLQHHLSLIYASLGFTGNIKLSNRANGRNIIKILKFQPFFLCRPHANSDECFNGEKINESTWSETRLDCVEGLVISNLSKCIVNSLSRTANPICSHSLPGLACSIRHQKVKA